MFIPEMRIPKYLVSDIERNRRYEREEVTEIKRGRDSLARGSSQEGAKFIIVNAGSRSASAIDTRTKEKEKQYFVTIVYVFLDAVESPAIERGTTIICQK